MAAVVDRIHLPYYAVNTFAGPAATTPASSQPKIPLCAGCLHGSTLTYYMTLSSNEIVEKPTGWKKAVCVEVIGDDTTTNLQLQNSMLDRKLLVVIATKDGDILAHESLREKLNGSNVNPNNPDQKFVTIKVNNNYVDFNISRFKWIDDEDYSPFVLSILLQRNIVRPIDYNAQLKKVQEILKRKPPFPLIVKS